MSAALTFVRTVVLAVFAIASALGVASGCVAAISWGVAALGIVPVIGIGAFVAGCVITAAFYAAAGRSLR